MAPLTRCRATPGTYAPNELMAAMYAARADAGLLIAEATIINEEARGFPNTPGVYSAEQTEGWRLVTDAVHARGGRIFLQLWHLGRTASKELNGRKTPIGPSACLDGSWANGFGGRGGEAREATLEDIARIISDFRKASENAKVRAPLTAAQCAHATSYTYPFFPRRPRALTAWSCTPPMATW